MTDESHTWMTEPKMKKNSDKESELLNFMPVIKFKLLGWDSHCKSRGIDIVVVITLMVRIFK